MNEVKIKTLVIGSTGHAHVKCVPWDGALSENLLDFDLIVTDLRTVPSDLLVRDPGAFRQLREVLSRFLTYEGDILVLGAPAVKINGEKHYESNYDWLPLSFNTKTESGDTITIVGDRIKNIYRL